MTKYKFIRETNSTNAYLQTLQKDLSKTEMHVVYTNFQTAGRGQMGNAWESERGKNLLFSLLFHPQHIALNECFYVSQLISVALLKVLSQHSNGFSIKWPNDIYYNDKKIAGILIENTIKGAFLGSTIIGVGLNVNQKTFSSYPHNPISLHHIVGHTVDRKTLMQQIVATFETLYNEDNSKNIRNIYFEHLYRANAWHRFSANNAIFEARIVNVETDGQLVVENLNGKKEHYYFKEISFCI